MTKSKPFHTIEQIMQHIQSDDDNIRNTALEEILKYKKDAIVWLIPLLGHTDEQVRDSAIWALCQMKEYAIETLIQELWNTNPIIRESAAFCLGISKDARATVSLIHLLKDENQRIRETAAWSLVKIGCVDQHTIYEIVNILNDNSILVRDTAKWILEHIGEPAFEPLLQQLLQSPHSSDDIISILAKITAPNLELLINLLTTTHDTQKLTNIICLLGQLREADAIQYLIPLLNHTNRQIIISTIQALINIGELTIEPLFDKINDESIFPVNEMMPLFIRYKKLSVPKLIEMLQSPNVTLRIFAARSLGVIEDKRAIEHLIQGIYDSHPQFVEACARALSAFSNRMIIKPLTNLLLNENYPIIKSNAIEALSKNIDNKTANELLTMFNDAPLIIKKRLIQLAAYFPSESSESLLHQALTIDDEECKMLAIQGLKHIGTDKSIVYVRRAIMHENPFLSDEARIALKEIVENNRKKTTRKYKNT